MIQKRKRLWALFLSAALIVTQLPAVAMAENHAPEDGSIASFEELPSGVKKQTVTVGTSLSELNLPDTVTATVYRVTEDTVIPDEDGSEDESGDSSTATPSDAKESVSENSSKDSSIKDSGETVTTVTTSTEQIPVTWDSDPVYDGDTPGKYIFTADADGYTLSSGARLPQITVSVTAEIAETPEETQPQEPAPCTKTEGCTLPDEHEGECVTAPPANDALIKTITGWTFVDDENLNEGELSMPGVSVDNQADFDTAVSMLPTQISAEIEGEAEPATLDITGWSCPEYIKDTDGNWPLTGDYTFTAALPEGYACAPLPTVKVVLGGAALYANDEYDGLTITAANGGAVTQETDGQIKLTQSGDYEISGTWSGTLDGVDRDNKKAVITVPANVTANVTLSGATITNVSGTDHACAFAVAADGTANITLSGTNTLTSGRYRAGLEVPETAAVTIDGDGSLMVNGGSSSAGIGGGMYSAGGTITITGGTVNATGGGSGAGIGGGMYSAGGAISITGGTVTANGGASGAGIGGGAGGSSGDITIGGRAEVTAAGSSDISIWRNDVSNGTIRIGDDAVVNATGGDSGAGIGGGGEHGGAGIGGGAGSGTSNNGRVEISGNAVVNATGGDCGAGIGGGYSGASGGSNGAGGAITITGGTVKANGGDSGAGIGGGFGGDGGDAAISGPDTKVTASGNNGGSDMGSGKGNSNGGSLSVTDGATLEMKNTGTNVTSPVYKDCTIIDKDGDSVKYGNEGKILPTLLLTAAPADFLALPGNVTLTATLSGAVSGNSGKTITFAVNSETYTKTTDSSGVATYTITNPSQGTYTFGASFAGDGQNNSVSAAEITGYTVNLGTQAALTVNGLGSAYTYGCEAFNLSTSGGSGSGAVSYASSDSSVASVTGNTVTILKAGTFTITATKAADSSYAEKSVTSGKVTASEATPNVNLSATGGSTTSDPITLTATVSKVGTGATPTGTVSFTESAGTLNATADLDSSGKASYTISNPKAGSHTYTAEYSGQTGYYNGASVTRTIGVGLTDQTGFTITVPGAKTYGDSDFTLTATGGQSTGGVSFSVPQNNGVLAVAADGKSRIIGAGKVTVTAAKDADSTYNQATATLELTVAPRDIANVTVNVTGDRVYTGSQLQPVFEVKDGALAITTGDYTNSYGSNVDAGTNAGSITFTGQRNYTGTKTVPFRIEKRSLTGAAITLEAGPFKQTGSAIEPAVTGVVAGGITVPAAAYDVSYQNNISAGDATVTVTAKAGGNFCDKVSTTFTIQEPDKPSGGGSSSSGGGSSYSEPEPQSSYTVAGDNISRSVSRSDLKKLADSGKSLTLYCDKASMTFDPAALKAILAAVPSTAGNITFTAAPADLSAFPDAAKQIGAHPVYDFTIRYKDGNGNMITVPVSFPAGSAAITLNYAPAAAEVTGSLFMVYVDGKGAVTWLDKSSYDNGKVLADAPHFSTYGVAYKSPAPVFTDISGHWAKQDIEFVAARGLLSGTGNGLFSPDGTMTRGMFVTALGRLAGVNPDSYQTRSFTDVKADAYYAAYVEWAAQKNIVKGTGDKLFSPGAPVTREQMAVMMTNYAGQMGYSIPTPLASVTFADNDKISAWAAKEVTAMQRAGIVKGKDGNRFDPQASATRAEVSAVLRRFVEIVIDPATATGWVKNDSGHWLYYRGGTALTGWQTIGKLRYFFNSDGVMHEGWKQDTDTNKWYYWTNAGAATGWREIDGKWYYFDENGVMAVNTKVDGYEVGPDGARK